MRKVTDPTLLAQLNGQQASPQQEQMLSPHQQFLQANVNPGSAGMQSYNVGQGLQNVGIGAGDEFVNAIGNVGKTITRNPDLIPTQHHTQPGASETAGHVIGDVAAYELARRLGGQALGVSAIAPSGATSILGNALYGASQNPENPSQGATIGGIAGALGEIPKYAGRALGKVGEFVNPEKKASEIAREITKREQEARQFGTEKFYSPAVNKHESRKIPKFEALDFLREPESYELYPVSVKKLVNRFDGNPTVGNAHSLQKEVGEMKRHYSRGEGIDLDRAKVLKDAEEYIKDALHKGLSGIEPGAGELYRMGMAHHAKEVVPFELINIPSTELKGSKKISPQRLLGDLQKIAAKNPEAIRGHYLSRALEELQPSVDRGRFFSFGAPEKISSMVQQPWLQGIAPGIESGYSQYIQNPALASILSQQAQQQIMPGGRR